MLFWTFSFLDQMCIFAPVCVSSITSDMKYSYKKHNLTVLKLGWLNLKVYSFRKIWRGEMKSCESVNLGIQIFHTYRISSNWTRILIEPSFQYNPNFCFLNLNYNPHSNITRNISSNRAGITVRISYGGSVM